MARVFKGMRVDALGAVAWVKSGRSDCTGNCVELARIGEQVAVRDSKDPHGPALLFGRADIAELVAGFKAGDHDHALTSR